MHSQYISHEVEKGAAHLMVRDDLTLPLGTSTHSEIGSSRSLSKEGCYPGQPGACALVRTVKKRVAVREREGDGDDGKSERTG